MLESDIEGYNDRAPPSPPVLNLGGPTEITSIEGGSVVWFGSRKLADDSLGWPKNQDCQLQSGVKAAPPRSTHALRQFFLPNLFHHP
jgi:hypothetical protein